MVHKTTAGLIAANGAPKCCKADKASHKRNVLLADNSEPVSTPSHLTCSNLVDYFHCSSLLISEDYTGGKKTAECSRVVDSFRRSSCEREAWYLQYVSICPFEVRMSQTEALPLRYQIKKGIKYHIPPFLAARGCSKQPLLMVSITLHPIALVHWSIHLPDQP